MGLHRCFAWPLLPLYSPTSANAATQELWSLYLFEQAVTECGVHLTEDQEDELDEAQLRARVELNLSRRDAGDLYRRAREAVRASREDHCNELLQTGSIPAKP